MFDTLGYVVLKQALSPDTVATLNAVLDRLEAADPADYPAGVCLGKERQADALYLSNIVEADPAFYDLIDHPAVLPIIKHVMLGLYRLNHTNAIYHWGGGYTYLHMAGSPLHPKATYMCQNGQIFSPLTKAVFPLMNHGTEDGCFAVVPGSHKANFPRPTGDHPDDNPGLVPLPADPGDCIIFTEALTHGSLVNTSGRPRRTIYYCYSVGYMPDWGNLGLTFSDDFPAKLSEAQREVIRLK
jgi:ectoine hydroxylase-related dioxygenase (phytanoyl-CoA dioxygenase family)